MVDLSISLGELLHQLIQSTYHDLSQLSELLPTKSDIERKIQLTKFARKTNHQFVRLLALANWASSPETSNSLATFTAHLDQQSRIYIETADLLYLQEREELRGSELPQFCIVSAIDILRYFMLFLSGIKRSPILEFLSNLDGAIILIQRNEQLKNINLKTFMLEGLIYFRLVGPFSKLFKLLLSRKLIN